MSGRCGTGSPGGDPGRSLHCERSPPPSAASPPASEIASRSAERIMPIVPSRSSYRKIPAEPSKVGAFILNLIGPDGQHGDAAAFASTGVQRATEAVFSVSSSGPPGNALRVAIVQCNVEAG
eukprot:CAMPEP_0115875016 /NCGR_PEP_ID=MMETSP0287-20121206/24864_1 /TAXON_ID=412157 /ORGANISM="Chrysochromulina rotalis, Strain UIO044" /LENGTH=121 /DNA_ID=CAMNT_0003330235 /DNA_START=364 /DNA_END=729 /DNA_ORIENTATION=-